MTAVSVWNLDTGKLAVTFPVEQPYCLVLSANSKQLYVGDRNGAITLWDLDTAKVVRILGSHPMVVGQLALSADGKRHFSSSSDTKVWNLEAAK